MCGRFTNRLTWREIVALYRLTVAASPERNLPARYNICPTTTIDTVIERDAKRELMSMRWGLVPSWWEKTAREAPSTFNARAETVAEKPMFRSAFKRSRCLIPASGYYKWQKTSTGKQPITTRPPGNWSELEARLVSPELSGPEPAFRNAPTMEAAPL
jgi:putative SOS response-associated peptidase YedK